MNYLAHSFLSPNNDAILMGNILTDMLPKKAIQQLPTMMQKGVKLHYFIDKYADNHPIVTKSISRIRSKHRKYSPVVIDVFYDYFLSKNWSRYSDISLEEFVSATYNKLNTQLPFIQSPFKEQLTSMIQHNWLLVYQSPITLKGVFNRIQKRAIHQAHFHTAIEDLKRYEAELNEDFNTFFPDIQEAVQSYLKDDL